MNLLLLLSALLSALTGIGASARAPEPAQAVAAVSVGRAPVAVVHARVASRPADALPPLAAIARRTVFVMAPVPAAPRWIDRRRE